MRQKFSPQILVKLKLYRRKGKTTTVDAVIDTGFDGSVCMSASMARRVGVNFSDHRRPFWDGTAQSTIVGSEKQCVAQVVCPKGYRGKPRVGLKYLAKAKANLVVGDVMLPIRNPCDLSDMVIRPRIIVSALPSCAPDGGKGTT